MAGVGAGSAGPEGGSPLPASRESTTPVQAPGSGNRDMREFQGFIKRRDEVKLRDQSFNVQTEGGVDVGDLAKRAAEAKQAAAAFTQEVRTGESSGQATPGVLNEPMHAASQGRARPGRREKLVYNDWREKPPPPGADPANEEFWSLTDDSREFSGAADARMNSQTQEESPESLLAIMTPEQRRQIANDLAVSLKQPRGFSDTREFDPETREVVLEMLDIIAGVNSATQPKIVVTSTPTPTPTEYLTPSKTPTPEYKPLPATPSK